MIKKEGIPAGYHRRKTMTYEQVKQDEAVRVYIDQADASLKALGFTAVSYTHLPAADDCLQAVAFAGGGGYHL